MPLDTRARCPKAGFPTSAPSTITTCRLGLAADTLPRSPRFWIPAGTGIEGKAAKLRPPFPTQIGVFRTDDTLDRLDLATGGPCYLGHRGQRLVVFADCFLSKFRYPSLKGCRQTPHRTSTLPLPEAVGKAHSVFTAYGSESPNFTQTRGWRLAGEWGVCKRFCKRTQLYPIGSADGSTGLAATSPGLHRGSLGFYWATASGTHTWASPCPTRGGL